MTIQRLLSVRTGARPGAVARGDQRERRWPRSRVTRRLLAAFLGAVLLAAGFAYGFAAKTLDLPPAPQLRSLATAGPAQRLLVQLFPVDVHFERGWRAREASATGEHAAAPDPAMDRQIAELEALGYASGSERAPERSGVTVHDATRAHPGVNLWVAGDGPRAVLMDMDGRVLHAWEHERPRSLGAGWKEDCGDQTYFRRAHLLRDGSLLAIYECGGLVELDRESRLVWAAVPGAHHDLDVLPDGRIWVLSHEVRMNPSVHQWRPVLEDDVVLLAPDGSVQRTIPVLAAFQRSHFRPTLRSMPPYGDILHTNTLEVLDGTLAGRVPAFAAGNLLLSVRNTDTVAVLDATNERIVWAMSGLWEAQHQPTVVDGGRLLVFDNRGRFGKSRVVELEPATQEVVWTFPESAEDDLYSSTLGSAQRLPNGNTLLTESNRGRALEVTPDGELVWEFFAPVRAIADRELIATLCEVVRLPAETASWVTGAETRGGQLAGDR